MKNHFVKAFHATVAASVCFLYFLHFRSEPEKLAYVNSVRLLDGYHAMVDARKQYKEKTGSWQANADTLMAEIQTALKKYESGTAGRPARERDEARLAIEAKQRQLAQYQQSIEEKSRQEDVHLTQRVVDRMNAFLTRYGKEHDYRIILAANQTGNIVYAKEGLDITDEVLEKLNNEYTRK